ncbi:hypothetical protein NG791_20100 [Laspinema sp. D1]|uniref:hypothetical protein n=1 Tax=Laspinema palackyanum TaxID=3231601 RepID=UPI003469B0D6|nr:hypothetical protein [Laspinema sp. D2b]
MNAVILNPHIVKLDSFDPNLLTALAQKARYLGGKFRTSLLPKKRVATLTFSTLPSVSLSEIVNEVINLKMNSTPTHISEQSLPNNTSSKSAEAIGYGIAPLTASAPLNPIAAVPSTATPAPTPSSGAIITPDPAPSSVAIAYGIAPLTALKKPTASPERIPSNEPITMTQSTTTPASLNETIAPEPETLDPRDNAKPSTANLEENTWASLADLLSQRKTKLKKLAQHHKIPGRSSMTHEQKAEALVGFVLARDL